MFQGLDQVRFDGILHEHRHGAFAAELMDVDGVAVQIRTDDDPAEAAFQVLQIRGKAQDGHDFRSHRDHEAVFPREAAGLAAQSHNDVAQGAVVHVHDAAPGDLAGIDAQLIPLLDVVVDHGRQQVVGCRDRMHIPREMEVDIVHRDDLGIAAAGSTALDAEHRSQGRFAQGYDSLLADLVQSLHKADARRGLAFTGRSRCNGRHEDQFAVGFVFQTLQHVQGDLSLIMAVLLQLFRMDIQLGGDLVDRFHYIFLGNLNIA